MNGPRKALGWVATVATATALTFGAVNVATDRAERRARMTWTSSSTLVRTPAGPTEDDAQTVAAYANCRADVDAGSLTRCDIERNASGQLEVIGYR